MQPAIPTPPSPNPDLPFPSVPERDPNREPRPEPWHDPGPPVRKVNLPPNQPSPGVPIEIPEQ